MFPPPRCDWNKLITFEQQFELPQPVLEDSPASSGSVLRGGLCSSEQKKRSGLRVLSPLIRFPSPLFQDIGARRSFSPLASSSVESSPRSTSESATAPRSPAMPSPSQVQIVHGDGTQTTVDVVVEKNDKVKTRKSKSKKVVFGTSFNSNKKKFCFRTNLRILRQILLRCTTASYLICKPIL